MAGSVVTGTRDGASFFRHRVGSSAQYWRDYVITHATNMAVLDEKQEQISRTIWYGLEFEIGWPDICTLIEAFTPYMERTSRWEVWQTILNKALTLAYRLGDTAGQVTLSALLARLLQRQSRFKPAITQYRQVIRLARQIGDAYNEARACSNLGFFYTEQGYWLRAETLGCYALTIFEQLNSDHGRAHTKNHLGLLYTRQHRWELAQLHLERACGLWQAIGDQHGLMRGYINLGLLYNDMEAPYKALSYLEQALHYAEAANEQFEIARIYTNLGITYRLIGEPAAAEWQAWRAEAIFRRFADPIGLATVHDNLGLACLDQEKWSEAKQYLNIALQSWRKLANPLGEIRALTYLVEYELARGNLRGAAAQFTKVERLVEQSSDSEQRSHWQSLLIKCRRSLARSQPDAAESSFRN